MTGERRCKSSPASSPPIMIPVSLLVRRPPALAAGNAAGSGRWRAAGRDVGGRGGAIAAIHHPAADQFLLLRHPFRADHPYRELCGQLRHSADRGGFDLQPRRALPGLFGRIGFGILGDRLGAKRVLVAGLLVQAFGALAYVFVRDLAALLCGRRRCSASSMPARCRYMRRSRARKLPAEDDGHRDRRHGDGGKPRHGHGAGGRRADLRHLCQLHVALCRLLGHGAGRVPDRDDLQAVPEDRPYELRRLKATSAAAPV